MRNQKFLYKEAKLLCQIKMVLNCLLLMAFILLFSIPVKAQVLELEVDANKKFQVIDGFGASDAWRCQFVGANWPTAKKQQMADWLFSQELDANGNPKGIGLSLWRFYISAGTTEQGDDSDIKNEWRRGESFIDAAGNYDWSKQAGQQWFLRKAKDAGVEKYLAFSIAAPTFWSFNQKGYAATKNGQMNLKPIFYEAYASFMVEVLKHFEAEGLPFDYLSPINEPQWDWEKPTQEGTPATNNNIAQLTRLLNAGIEEKKLGAKLVLAEAADLRFLYSEHNKPERSEQIKEFYADTSRKIDTYIKDLSNVIPTVSGHSYFTTWPVQDLIQIRQKLNQELIQNNIDYWQSEFCILEDSKDIGGGQNRDLGIATALYVARVIHADLTLANAKSWQWWTAITIADFKDGLIYLDTGNPEDMYNKTALKTDGEFHDSKLLWALGNYSRFIRPGFQRIAASYNNSKSLEDQYQDLMISAYKNPDTGDQVVVLINYADADQQIKINTSDTKFLHAYETSEDKNLEHRTLSSNHVTLAARSITTLTNTNL
ncbi:glycoside hydrolase family 30 protein [Leeuwenhoekiella sp. MAR_2009_132]|uniref:glycoside hydrolase family 30 protein n=1 Tax=Leeuwenhoekiella sp. MAR_2009_132 TaxID=1392489 RepID=UPI00055B6625|nr:glycoside hydrolase family 30 protein [Leeuwenhoekiella sp. MAR_2009_132]